MYNEVIKLIKEHEPVKDRYGNEAPRYTARKVRAEIRDIGM